MKLIVRVTPPIEDWQTWKVGILHTTVTGYGKSKTEAVDEAKRKFREFIGKQEFWLEEIEI